MRTSSLRLSITCIIASTFFLTPMAQAERIPMGKIPTEEIPTEEIPTERIPVANNELTNKAIDLFERGNLNDANVAGEKATQKFPGDWQSHAALSFLAWKQGNIVLALSEGEAAQRLAPENETLLTNLARMNEILGDYNAALVQNQTARKLADSCDAGLGVARCNIKLARKDAGFAVLAEMASRPNKNFEWYEKVADTYLQVGDAKSAIKTARAALNSAVNDKEKAKGREDLLLGLLRSAPSYVAANEAGKLPALPGSRSSLPVASGQKTETIEQKNITGASGEKNAIGATGQQNVSEAVERKDANEANKLEAGKLEASKLEASKLEASKLKDIVFTQSHPRNSEIYVLAAQDLLDVRKPEEAQILWDSAKENLKSEEDADGFYRLGRIFQNKANLSLPAAVGAGDSTFPSGVEGSGTNTNSPASTSSSKPSSSSSIANNNNNNNNNVFENWIDYAKLAYEKAIELDPRQGRYHIALAGCIGITGNREKFESELKQAKSMDQFDALSVYLLSTPFPLKLSKATFRIKGLTCSCHVSKVETTLCDVPGVAFAHISREETPQGQNGVLLFDPSKVDLTKAFAQCNTAFNSAIPQVKLFTFDVLSTVPVRSTEEAVKISQDEKYGDALQFFNQIRAVEPVLPIRKKLESKISASN